MSIALPSTFAHELKTCKGFVSNNDDEYQKTKDKLTKLANTIFGDKPAYNYWGSKTTNAVVIQLDGNYFVIDTDDEESDTFVMDVMSKYGVIDNVTPSLSNYLLGKKNKNHYWFRLPEDIRWTCKTNWVKGGKQDKKNSHLDLLGSKNRIMFENKECLDRLKNIPFLSQEMLNDICDYVPAALLGQQLDFSPKQEKKTETKTQKENVLDTTLTNTDKECPQDIKDFIDANLNATLSLDNDTFFYNGCYLLRRYGDEKNGRGWKAVHYFAKMAGKKIYNKEKVDTWLSGTKIENMKPSYATKIKGKCLITLEDDCDESDLSDASTIVENKIVVVKQKTKVATSEEEVAEIAYEKLKNDYMYVNKQFYGKHGNVWSNDLMQFESLLRNAIVDLKIKKRTEKMVKGAIEYIDVVYCNTRSHIMAVFNRVIDKIVAHPRDDMTMLFHSTTLGKICFEDGVYDFRKKQFNKWNDEYLKENPVYSCVKITRNFPRTSRQLEQEDEKRMKKVFYDSMGEESAEIFLKYLARVTAGEIQDKSFASLIFERDSSKGVINDWFETAFQNYVGQVDSDSFLTKHSIGDSEKENGWLIPFQYKRFMFVSEFTVDFKHSKKTISSKLVKSINSGGDTLKGRYMRENGVNFKLQVSSIFMGNDMPPPDSNDMFEKCLQLTSSVQFKTQEQINELLSQVEDTPELVASRTQKLKVADHTLRFSVKTDDYADSLVRLMIKYYSDKAITLKQTKHIDEEQESLDIKILSRFVMTGLHDDRVTNEVLREFARDTNVGLKKLKETISNIDNRVKEYKTTASRGLSGMKVRPSPSSESTV
jgi:hypothetical protein